MKTLEDQLVQIGKLLNQAERAGTEAEAETFYAAAFAKAARHSIEMSQARAALARLTEREQPIMRTITLGERRQHNLAVFCELFMAIGRAYDIKFNISSYSTYVVAFGMPSDIDLTEALYESLVTQMMQAARAYIKSGEWKGETDYRFNRKLGHHVIKSVDSKVVKRNFFETFTRTVGRRVREAHVRVKSEIVSTEEVVENGKTSTELVLVGKSVEVSDFYKQKSTARGTWKGSQSTYVSHGGQSAGRAAGERANISGSTKAIRTNRKAIGS